MNEYKPIELAQIFNLHPNTIRFYESIGYISKAKRKPNGYRQFTDEHVFQLTICRYILGYRYTNRRIRDTGKLIINSASKGELIAGKQYAYDYIKIIQNEIGIAEKTSRLLHKWAESKHDIDNSANLEKLYTRKEVASLLGVTSEAVRNWERNGLIKSDKRSNKNEVIFNNIDLDRMQIIYMLRQYFINNKDGESTDGGGFSIFILCLSLETKGFGLLNKVIPIVGCFRKNSKASSKNK